VDFEEPAGLLPDGAKVHAAIGGFLPGLATLSTRLLAAAHLERRLSSLVPECHGSVTVTRAGGSLDMRKSQRPLRHFDHHPVFMKRRRERERVAIEASHDGRLRRRSLLRGCDVSGWCRRAATGEQQRTGEKGAEAVVPSSCTQSFRLSADLPD